MKQIKSQTSCTDCKLKSMLFQELSKQELISIDRFKKTISYRKGEIICHEGAGIKEIMYLKFGLVKLYKKSLNNRDQIISIAKPLDYVSLLTVFSNSTYQYSITAIEDSIICSFDADKIRELVLNNASFGVSIIEKVGKTYDEIIKLTFEIKRRHLRGRIAYILLNFSNHIYYKDTFDLPISRREIAELIEMTTENVIRILSEFRKDKIIGIDGKQIAIMNKPLLEKISELG